VVSAGGIDVVMLASCDHEPIVPYVFGIPSPHENCHVHEDLRLVGWF